ncbi:hypothetical protein Mgra_00007930 [Meloidogyne graminicola]|uniref:Uncharacterized protein n=1 Tax=Meloidogyne graminicola TaxID=189291 RepID=A0A8S9ZHA7_9BILA|nr:hypothetical protein Mgra_00007930 [Meloidogyne graminicola]
MLKLIFILLIFNIILINATSKTAKKGKPVRAPRNDIGDFLEMKILEKEKPSITNKGKEKLINKEQTSKKYIEDISNQNDWGFVNLLLNLAESSSKNKNISKENKVNKSHYKALRIRALNHPIFKMKRRNS